CRARPERPLDAGSAIYVPPALVDHGPRLRRFDGPLERVDDRERVELAIAGVPDRDAQLDDLAADHVARGDEPAGTTAHEVVAAASARDRVHAGADELVRAHARADRATRRGGRASRGAVQALLEQARVAVREV